ncbi:M4 family metallopeptidase [Amycolatopsis nigrescens]|uniref:M4 family metallopeptidase n=1 Tax=Amycolatopsis nigrescens TaxID=381445 RepID=UPI000368D89B|nr:M4 family metallopeptidase [Amycolatopsis nigrescens]
MPPSQLVYGLAALLGVSLLPVHAEAEPPEAVLTSAAERLLDTEPARVHRDPHDSFALRRVTATPGGPGYAAYERYHRGLPVRGGGVVVVTDAGGRLRDVELGMTRPLTGLPVRPAITAVAAETTAKQVSAAAHSDVVASELVVHAVGAPRLAWEIVITGMAGRAPSRSHVFIDARTGERFAGYDEVKAATGRGEHYGEVPVASRKWVDYELVDPSRGYADTQYYPSRATFTDEDDRWDDGSPEFEKHAVDAHYGTRVFWDMLRDRFARNGLDGRGTMVPVVVGWEETNAYFNNMEVVLGRNADNTRQLTAFDVVGHELGHAVDATTGMPPSAALESGALGEATGDIFGALTEAHAAHPSDPPDFSVGELVHINGEGSGAFRFMYQPSLDGRSPDCYGDLPDEVHYAAGPANHFFYLLAKGTSPAGGPASPTCDGSVHPGLGVWAAAEIWYHALHRKFDWDYGYSDLRRYTLAAAIERYPGCAEFTAVRNAWNAVAVPAVNDPSCT